MKSFGIARVLTRFFKDETGATSIEYGLIASLIAVAIIGGFSSLGSALKTLWGDNNAAIGKAFQ
jgi:pilus assembly protein Flp/PilA